jgi:tripartite-type tricarboxylate transporter receptor subunit TctC
MKLNRLLRYTSLASVLLVTGLISSTALAQTFPTKPIRLIVPFPPGGPNDTIARVVAEGMRESLGQPVVVENRAGAGGMIGSEAGAKSAPDGYTLTLGSTSTHSLPTVLGQKIPFDPRKSFVPVGMIGLSPTVLAVSNKVPATTIGEFIAYAQKNPGKLSYASSGVGSLNHLAAESFKLESKTFIVHVPYRGTGQAMTDLVGGQVDMMFDAVITAKPQADAGRIKILATGGRTRVAALRNVPPLTEIGMKGFDASLWLGVFAPSGTPQDITEKLNTAMGRALRNPAIEERLQKSGVFVSPGPASELTTYMQIVENYWKNIVTVRGIKPE